MLRPFDKLSTNGARQGSFALSLSKGISMPKQYGPESQSFLSAARKALEALSIMSAVRAETMSSSTIFFPAA